MVSLAIKALLLIWPFLKRGLFGDLTVKEVVLANMHLTTVYLCVCILIYMQLYTIVELSVVKSERHLANVAMCIKPETIEDTLIHRRQMFGEILK